MGPDAAPDPGRVVNETGDALVALAHLLDGDDDRPLPVPERRGVGLLCALLAAHLARATERLFAPDRG